MIGWTAFAACILGYGAFTAVVVLNRMGEIAMREALLIGGPAAVIGEVGLWVAAGHEGLGVTTAPGTAALLTALVLGRTPPIEPAPFGPRRPMPAHA